MKLFSKILDYLLPRRCIFCNTPIYTDAPCCDNCEALIPYADSVCSICGKSPCICAQTEFAFRAVTPVFLYESGAKNAIQKLKFNEHLSYAKPLAQYLHARLLQCDYCELIDVIIPIPMTKRAIHNRGYNQSVLLAQELSKLSGITTDAESLKKRKETRKQHDLNSADRQVNLHGAFAVTAAEKITGKTILLCDDVYTTGATFDEAARTLLVAGAKEIFCIAVATTLHQ